MNQAKIVKLARPADTIVVGNPAIADASVQDASTIVLTGKGFGVTNLVVLDVDGNPIVDEQVTVVRQTASSVRVYRRADIQTLVLHALLRELLQERRRADLGSRDERQPVGSAGPPARPRQPWLAAGEWRPSHFEGSSKPDLNRSSLVCLRYGIRIGQKP